MHIPVWLWNLWTSFSTLALTKVGAVSLFSAQSQIHFHQGCPPSLQFCSWYSLTGSQVAAAVRRVFGSGNSELCLCFLQMTSVLLTSSVRDLQLAPWQFAVQCEVAKIRISTSKCEAMVPCRKTVKCSLRVGSELLSLSISGSCSGEMKHEIERRIGAASAVM